MSKGVYKNLKYMEEYRATHKEEIKKQRAQYCLEHQKERKVSNYSKGSDFDNPILLWLLLGVNT